MGKVNGDAAILSLPNLRKTMTADEKRMVRDSMNHIERDLVLALPEMLAGVQATRKQSSMSPTIAFSPTGKRGRNVKLKVSSRVRAEREGFEADYHITADGQLALGLEDEPVEAGDGDGAEPSSPGFDDTGGGDGAGLH